MATPKKKISRSRRNMRRFSTAYKLEEGFALTACPECGEQIRAHRVCGKCLSKGVVARKA
jgi:ribosomal protein L32